jgi:hypothetical protein
MATLADAFNKIRADNALAKKFVSDPTGTLKSLGVDTSKLHVRPSHTTHTISYAKGSGAAASATVCGSAGCGACVSVG